MATLQSTLTWIGEVSPEPSKKWLLSMNPLHTATDNIGIPSYPFIKKVYVSMAGLRDKTSALDSAQDESTVVEEYLKGLATFVRVAEDVDGFIPTVETLADEIVTKISTDWYQSVTYQDTDDNTINVSATGNELGDKNPYLLRTKETEHLSMEGWVYFRDSALVNLAYTTYDEAKKIKDAVEHRLEWMTKSEDSDTYTPLSAGVASISPPRGNNLPNSMKVVGIRAGDIIRLNISGGSGEYAVSTSDSTKLEELSSKTYRLISNESTTLHLQVSDNSTHINTVITLTIETEEMEA